MRKQPKPSSHETSPATMPATTPAVYPLTEQQHALWLTCQLDPGSTYNTYLTYTVKGALDIDRYRAAVALAARYNPSIRTRFNTDKNGQVVQCIDAPDTPVTVEVFDLTSTPSLRAETLQVQARALLEEHCTDTFTLDGGPLSRFSVIKWGPDDYFLSLVQHHIVSDALSGGLFADAVTLAYGGQRAALEAQFDPAADVSRYLEYRAGIDPSKVAASIDYWRKKLTGAQLPTRFSGPTTGAYTMGELSFDMGSDLASGIKKLARRTRSTVFLTLTAGLASLLHRYFELDDLVVGYPVNERPAGHAKLFGYYVSVQAFRLPPVAQETFSDLLTRLTSQRKLDASHPTLGLQELMGFATRRAASARGADLNVAVSPTALSTDNLKLDGVHLSNLETCGGKPKQDLSLLFDPRGPDLPCVLRFNQALFPQVLMKQFVGHLRNWLQVCCEQPQRAMGELKFMGEAEQQRLLRDWAEPHFDAPQHSCIHSALQAHIDTTPHHPAVRFENHCLTYGQLGDRVDAVAHRLRERQVLAGDTVAVCLEPSLLSPVAMFGCFKAGAVYVPIAPDWPDGRIRTVLAGCQPTAILTSDHLFDRLASCAHPASTMLDIVSSSTYEPAQPDLPALAGDEPAYIIHTSGSTGTPKGVVVSHSALLGTVEHLVALQEITPQDRVLLFASIAFDASLAETCQALLAGATVVVAPSAVRRDPVALRNYMQTHGTTVVALPPAMIRAFERAPLPTVRVLLTAGEAAGAADVAHYARHHVVINGYGPTEAAVCTSCYVVPKTFAGDRVPIGRPRPGLQCYVLDSQMQPAPAGVAGELYVGGPGLARGYLNQDELTKSKFLPNPFDPSTRLYRTGDQAKWLPDGNLDFIGRLDGQVQVRGFRIELGEIEAVLSRHPGLSQVACVARPSAGSHELVAYYVPSPEGATLEAAQLRAFVAAQLPDYMLPNYFLSLPHLPTTVNGKVDRAQLGDRAPRRQVSSREPSTQTEIRVARAWCAVLDLPSIGIGDDFFSLGGHSLLATQLSHRLSQEFSVQVRPVLVLRHPTVAGLSLAIEGLKAPATTIVKRANDGLAPPCSYAQERLWALHRLGQDRQYHVPVVLRLDPGATDEARLRQALNCLIERHASLRTGLVGGPLADGRHGAVQVVATAMPFPLTITSAKSAREQPIATLLTELFQRPFDLSRPPLLRGLWIRRDTGHDLLALCFHHAVVDAWSLRIVLSQLAQLIEHPPNGGHRQSIKPGKQRPTGGALQHLPTPPGGEVGDGVESHTDRAAVQYTDFAAFQRSLSDSDAWARSLMYFQDRLSGCPDLDLPIDLPRPPHLSGRGGRETFELHPASYARLKALCRAQGTTAMAGLVSAVYVLLSRHCRQQDLCIGVPVDGRGAAETQDMVGFFVNTVALRIRLEQGQRPTARTLIGQTGEQLLETLAHQEVPFQQVVKRLNRPSSPARSPLFQALVNLTEQPKMSGPVTLCQPHELAEVQYPYAKFELTFDFTERPDDRADLQIEYSSDLLQPATVSRMGQQLTRMIERMSNAPDTPIDHLEMSDTDERHMLLHRWSGAARKPAAGQGSGPRLETIFRAVAARAPNAVALAFEHNQVTYGELDQQSDRLAGWLHARGLPLEARIGVALPRGQALYVALLAVVKSGLAYVPLDMTYPDHRLSTMATDSCLTMVLTDDNGVLRLAGPLQNRVLVDVTQLRLDDQPRLLASPTGSSSSGLAYVMYTSGSSGKPKGVMVEHRGVTRLVQDTNYISIKDQDVLLQYAPVAFDAATFEIWGALLNGSTLACPPAGQRSFTELAQFVRQHHVSVAWFTAALFESLVHNHIDLFCDLRVVLAGGDVLSKTAASLLLATYPQLELINGYGPTENTTFTCCHRVTPDLLQGHDSVAIGRPITGTTVYILDTGLRPVPVGVHGELYTGGTGLARGYLGADTLTADRFVDNPFSPGTRLYRTGDLARFRPNGDIEFAGRIDSQIKVRGIRVEPSEIEALLVMQPSVQKAAVVAQRRGSDAVLIAYYVKANPDAVVTKNDLAGPLRAQLPPALVPEVYISLDALPLTHNHKVDRRELAQRPLSPAGDHRRLAPRSSLERQLVELWEDTLSIRGIGVDDDFFSLGGTSLMAVQLLDAMKIQVGLDIGVDHFLQSPTIDGVCNPARQHPTLDLAAESAMLRPENIAPRSTMSSRPAQHVLLTGATGFVGAFLLDALMSRTSAQVHCLVRGQDMGQARSRLADSMARYGLPLVSEGGRIEVVIGDLREPGLGLDRETTGRLAEQIDVIYHCGAEVHHLQPYSRLRAANVDGTKQIVRLACQTKLKPIHFVSTLNVLTGFRPSGQPDSSRPSSPPSPSGSAGVLDEFSSIHDGAFDSGAGYPASKWVAEAVIERARGWGVPCGIYRLGRVTSAQGTGSCNRQDFFFRYLTTCADLGMCCDLQPGNLQLTPVDFAAGALVQLGGDVARHGRTFHLDLDSTLTLSAAAQAYSRRPLRRVSLAQWADSARIAMAQGRELSFAPYLPALDAVISRAAPDAQPGSSAPCQKVSSAHTTETLRALGMPIPSVDTRSIVKARRFLDRQQTTARSAERRRPSGQPPLV